MNRICVKREEDITRYIKKKEFKGCDKKLFVKGFFGENKWYSFHLICYINYQQYYAINLDTDQIFKVTCEGSDDTDYSTYKLEVVSLDSFKEYVRNCSRRYYELIRHITPETQWKLRDFQFGRATRGIDVFIKLKTDAGLRLLSYFKDEDRILVKYAEMDAETYDKHFEHCRRTGDVFEIFDDQESAVWDDESVMYIQKVLKEKECAALCSENGDRIICRTTVEEYCRMNYIHELESVENITDDVINLMGYMRHLMNKNGKASFVPENIPEEEIVEVVHTKTAAQQSDSEVNESFEKKMLSKKRGLLVLMCLIFAIYVIVIIGYSIIVDLLQ